MVAKLPSMVVSAVTTFDGKALTKGSKQISGFASSAKKALGALGLAALAVAAVKFGKNSVKAFADNEKSAKRLAGVVKNLGQAFETPFIEANLDQISAKFGYSGEVLREAYQKLITATGSATKSNELLNASLDIAAGSGESLASVNQDLAALYVGNTKGLKKYNLGLSQAELKTLDFESGLALLTKTFKGAAGNELDTYSGKMRVLGEAADNAQEIIGESLVDAFMILAGDTTTDDLAESMATLATNTSNVITELAKLGKAVSNFAGESYGKVDRFSDDLTDFIDRITFNSERIAEREAQRNFPRMGGYPSSALGPRAVDPNIAKRDKIERDRIKKEKERLALAAKAAREEKNKISLSKAAAAFDSTRISLTAALQATYDKETKLRLEALKLIEEDKGDEALKKIGELAAFQKNADMQRLAGVTEISNATLASLNTQLLTELKVINGSRMAEGDKELAREEAFKKYNAAITAAGTLSAKESYNERVQIQLTEIARLASISKTYSAAATANLLLQSSELSMIDRVAIAQKAADDQRLAALKDYQNALNGIGGSGGGGGGTGRSMSFIENGPLGGLAAGVIAGVLPTLSQMPTLTDTAPTYGYNPTQGFPGQSIELTINTGIGDPEAISRAVEDLLNQSSYRGTSTNRGSGNYIL
jgi:hypothetical protein